MTQARTFLDGHIRDAKRSWVNYRIPRNFGPAGGSGALVRSRRHEPQLERVADDYAVPVFSGGRARSTSGNYQLAQRCARQRELRHAILDVGDDDVDGVHLHIHKAWATAVAGYLAEDAPDVEVEFIRVADNK